MLVAAAGIKMKRHSRTVFVPLPAMIDVHPEEAVTLFVSVVCPVVGTPGVVYHGAVAAAADPCATSAFKLDAVP